MGGFGSGGHNQRRLRTEHFRKLDAAGLQRAGLFREGRRGTVSWKSGQETDASIAVIGGQNAIALEYKGKPKDSPSWTDFRERFGIDWSERHFGGAQAYFTCRGCGKRARLLYLAYFRFRCRACHGLVHASSQERPGDRATRKNQKLREKIGAPLGLGDIVLRPKGMHNATFSKYVERICGAEQEVWDDAARFLKRLRAPDAAFLETLKESAFWR